jgi:hypothetical protein
VTSPAPEEQTDAAFSVERWSATSGSQRSSRADLVLDGGGRKWRAHASGNGAIDALLRAVDLALGAVLGDGVELQTYNVHATGHGHETAAVVTLSLRPRGGDPQAPAYPGRGTHDNVLEASLVAYVDAINRLVGHAGVDVAAAAPAPGVTPLPSKDDQAASRRAHSERFSEMFNPD